MAWGNKEKHIPGSKYLFSDPSLTWRTRIEEFQENYLRLSGIKLSKNDCMKLLMQLGWERWQEEQQEDQA